MIVDTLTSQSLQDGQATRDNSSKSVGNTLRTYANTWIFHSGVPDGWDLGVVNMMPCFFMEV